MVAFLAISLKFLERGQGERPQKFFLPNFGYLNQINLPLRSFFESKYLTLIKPP